MKTTRRKYKATVTLDLIIDIDDDTTNKLVKDYVRGSLYDLAISSMGQVVFIQQAVQQLIMNYDLRQLKLLNLRG